jgi:hypothetical protein
MESLVKTLEKQELIARAKERYPTNIEINTKTYILNINLYDLFKTSAYTGVPNSIDYFLNSVEKYGIVAVLFTSLFSAADKDIREVEFILKREVESDFLWWDIAATSNLSYVYLKENGNKPTDFIYITPNQKGVDTIDTNVKLTQDEIKTLIRVKKIERLGL